MEFNQRSQAQLAADAAAQFKSPVPEQQTVPTPPPDHPLATVGAAPAQAPAAPKAFDGAKPAAAPTAAAPAAHFEPTDPKVRKLYDANQQRIGNAHLNMSKSQQSDMRSFEANYAKHIGDYDKVSAQSDLPPELIAALHWREGGGNFHTYLAQGDPLGKKAVHVPNNQPVRSDWALAAEDAVGAKDKHSTQEKLNIHKDSTDMAALATYSEYYNGLGYANKDKPSPYVFSGTNQYTSGKFVKDHVYNPNVKDSQLGVMAMVEDLREKEQQANANKAPTPK